MSEEIWKDVVGFEGYYKVSNLGRVKSVDRYVNYKKGYSLKALKKGQLLSPKISNKGYLHLTLMKDGKNYYRSVHRIVAEAFIPNPKNLPFINHINENKVDDRVENLEWCTAKYNTEVYYKSRINVYQYDLEGKLIKIWHSITEAAENINGDKTGIQHSCRTKRGLKSYKGFIWSYQPLTSEEFKRRITNENITSVNQIDSSGNIICTYKSMSEAGKAVGCNPSAISMACSGLRHTIKGYRWTKN